MDYNFGYCIRNDLINFLTANQCKIILSISKSLNIQNTVNEELSTLIDRIREAKIDDILM